MKRCNSSFIVIVFFLWPVLSYADRYKIDGQLTILPSGEEVGQFSAKLPMGEIRLESSPSGQNVFQALTLNVEGQKPIVLKSGVVGVYISKGIADVFGTENKISLLVVSLGGNEEIWRYKKVADVWQPDGIGSIGGYNTFSSETKKHWLFTSPDDLRTELINGGELVLTVTHQPLVEGSQDMMVLRNGKPFHPWSVVLPGLDKIPEDPLPANAIMGQDIIIIPQEEVKPRKPDSSKP
jgi:hypothetical protein